MAHKSQYSCSVLHGGRRQEERQHNLAQFRYAERRGEEREIEREREKEEGRNEEQGKEGHASSTTSSYLTLTHTPTPARVCSDGDVRFLISSDVGARGLDIKALPFIINYTLPDKVHLCTK